MVTKYERVIVWVVAALLGIGQCYLAAYIVTNLLTNNVTY